MYGMGMNLGEKTEVMRISRPSFLLQIVIDQKQLDNVEYFNCLVVFLLYYIMEGSQRLMPPDALQPKAYCINPGL